MAKVAQKRMGRPPLGVQKTSLQIRVSPEVARRLRVAAADRNIRPGALAEQVLGAHLPLVTTGGAYDAEQ